MEKETFKAAIKMNEFLKRDGGRLKISRLTNFILLQKSLSYNNLDAIKLFLCQGGTCADIPWLGLFNKLDYKCSYDNFGDQNFSRESNVEIIQLLFDSFVDLMKENGGAIPSYLITNICKSNIEAIKIFMKYGANINLSVMVGLSPLWLSISSSNVEAAKLFMSHGANINNIDLGCTLLHYYAYIGDQNKMNLLIELGADCSFKISDEITPLICFICSAHEKFTSLRQKLFKILFKSVNLGDIELRFNTNPIRHWKKEEDISRGYNITSRFGNFFNLRDVVSYCIDLDLDVNGKFPFSHG
jgi:hypothetical protein